MFYITIKNNFSVQFEYHYIKIIQEEHQEVKIGKKKDF